MRAVHLLISLLASHSTTSWALPPPQSPALPVPGQTSLYSSFLGKAAPYPGNESQAIPATSPGPPGPDDELFQNLLSAEWIVFSLYQQAAEQFNASSFAALGYPNNTYDRILQIRDNEAGHLTIFQEAISSTSIKPGPCKYNFGFTSATEWLVLQTLIEISSMAFLTGLVQEAKLPSSRAVLLAIGETESRHNAWSLMQIWNTSPFAGPSDTVFPYANQILSTTKTFIVNGSCPSINPSYPTPNQDLPVLDFNRTSSRGYPGDTIQFLFPSGIPQHNKSGSYFSVYFHGTTNISMPFKFGQSVSTVPQEFDRQAGIIIAVIAKEPGASSQDSVIAGPLVLLQQPSQLTQFA